MKFSEFQPINEATPPVPAKPGPAQPAAKASAATAKMATEPPVPAKPGPAQPAAKASAATAKMAPKPPVPAKPGPAQPAAKASAATAKMAPKPPVPGSKEDMANRIGNYLDNVSVVDMPNAFTKQITHRNAEIVDFESPTSRDIKAKLNVDAGADTTGLSPEQAAELKRQSLAARAEMNDPASRDPHHGRNADEIEALEKDLEKHAT
jgi:hypothetical protein